MQGNKLKDKALLKVQSKIWEQKRFIREIESDVEKNNNKTINKPKAETKDISRLEVNNSKIKMEN